MKSVRKAVRTFLINDNKVIVIKYKTNKNMNYYDIPGGKIEENESAINASIREFKEETGIEIINQKYKGNVIVEYPNMIFDFDIYLVNDYKGYPKEFEEIHIGSERFGQIIFVIILILMIFTMFRR